MLFSYNWLKEYIQNLPKPEKLAELLTMHSFEVAEIKKEKGDYIFNVDVLPNRGHDCLCHLGIARETAAITGAKLKYPETAEIKEVKGKIKPLNLKINCPKLVPRYSAIVIEGITIKKSPQWLRDRLEAVGIRSINNIVDLTNYVMLETGQPLHAFDYDKIKDKKMILREARKGEKVITLDDAQRTLDNGMLVVEDKKRLIDLVGIMGGKLSEVDSKTKNIILQAGNFDRRTIYVTTRELNHKTDASNIYIQGIDPNLTMPALERCLFLLKKLSSGKVVQTIDLYPRKTQPKKIKLEINRVEKLLGGKISEKEIVDILKRLDFEVKKMAKNSLLVQIPTSRIDISLPEDLIEEIGRIHGYEKIKPDFPLAPLIPARRNINIFWENNAKNILKELGFAEVYNYSFISEKEAEILGYKKETIEVANPVSIEQKYLRPSLIPGLLKNAKENLKFFDKIKIFELGKIFGAEQGRGFKERNIVAGLISDGDFYQLKGMVEAFLNKVGIPRVNYAEHEWHSQKCAQIKIGKETVGFLGEMPAEILKELKVEGKMFLFEIDFGNLIRICREECEYKAIAQFPASTRDLSLLVPKKVRVSEALEEIKKVSNFLVQDISLFDIYEGKEIPAGKKNLAFRITYQAEDRTLKSKEIEELQQKIIKILEKNPGWEVRR